MPRHNKKTRIKGLPPRLQLQQKDAATGSYPSNVRIATDNRTGKYEINYNDLSTIGFGNTSNILDNVVSYWRFNSGSLGEVVPINLTPPSASYTVFPTYLGRSLTNVNANKTLTFLFAEPPTFDQFSTNIPFTGPSDDPNQTSIDFFPFDKTVGSGSIVLFNPGSTVAVSGAKEKEFSVAFWMDRVGVTTPVIQTIVSVAEPTAIQQPVGVTTGSIFQIEHDASTNRIRVILSDPNNNGIGKRAETTITTNWTHVAVTYDGTKSSAGIKIYIDGLLQTNTLNLFKGTFGAYVGMTSSINAHNLYIGALANATNASYDGWLDEMIFFDRVLQASEIKDLALFRRSLNRPKENPLTGIYYGLGLPTNSRFIDSPTEQTTSLFGLGKVTKGIGDSIVEFTPGQDLEPYKELDLPALDGLSSTSSWYQEGSPVNLVGEGFDQPLWAKTKIEIDLTPRVQHSFGIRASGNLSTPSNLDNHIMAYWNHEAKVWQGIGNGAPLNKYEGHSTGATPQKLFLMFSELCNGFGGNIDSGGFSNALTASSTVISNPINNFGFPYDAKYKATSSNYINISDYINEPFLVEKIVLMVSATLDFRDAGDSINGTAAGTEPCITTFFILNQRTGAPVKAETAIFWASGSSTPRLLTTQSLTANTSRDLITWTQISKRVLSGPAAYRAGFVRDANYDRINSRVHFNQQFFITASAKTPIEYERGFYNPGDIPSTFSPDQKAGQYFETWNTSGRNNTGDFGRNHLNVFIKPEIFGQMTFGGIDSWVQNFSVDTNTFYSKPNPYLLLPGDQLILGWNLPTGKRAFIRRPDGGIGRYMLGQVQTSINQLGPRLTFGPTGKHKLIIYGSQIRNQKEYHDTLNQLLTSNTVHEVIG